MGVFMLANPTSRQCQTCGNQLESSGDCHACLLQLGISQAGGENGALPAVSLPNLADLNAQFPQLDITRLIGRGGMGAIYHARQTALDRDVALKLIAKEVSSDAAFVERFEREAKTLAKLSHPNIVTIYDFGRTPDGLAYLIMEFVDGINLREAISSNSVGSDEALQVVSTICHALEYAHAKGVVHRDIKPENILLGEDGTLKVADFGIAKIVDQSVRTPTLTATRQVLGSLHYLAPEHLEAPDQVDHRVDLYALGVIFYELLTGQLPLGRYEAPSKVQHRVDQRFDAIVLKTLSRKPQQRYQNAAELDADLDQIATSLKAGEMRPTGAEDATPRPPLHGGKAASVPFTCEAMGGFAEGVGVVHARPELLCAEFRIRDAFGGNVKSRTHVVEIPRDDLTRLEFVPGIFSSKLVITASTISALGTFPNAETGCVELKIKRKDEPYARDVTRTLGFESSAPVDQWASSDSATFETRLQPIDANQAVFAVLMIMCGALNGAGLGITETILARELNDIPLVAASVGAAVLLGPVAIIQLVTGILNLLGRPHSLNLAAALISMLPVSPVWILSFPTGAVAYRWFRPKAAAAVERSVPRATNWGTTTMMWIRESRWSKTVGILNVAAAALIVAGFVAYKSGYYPTKMRYRIVDSDVVYSNLMTTLEARLGTSDGASDIQVDSLEQPRQLTIRAWQRFRPEVQQLLSVPETPQLVWLESDPGSGKTTLLAADGNEPEPFPVASGMDVSSLRTAQTRLGRNVHAVGVPLDLSSDLVSRVSTDTVDQQPRLVVELTSKGRELLHAGPIDAATNDEAVGEPVGEAAVGGIGLVIDGLVEGIARHDSMSPKRIVFVLAAGSELTLEGIVAGIRGPNLPTPLEQLDKNTQVPRRRP